MKAIKEMEPGRICEHTVYWNHRPWHCSSSLALASSRRSSPHGICGRQSDTGTGFLQVF